MFWLQLIWEKTYTASMETSLLNLSQKKIPVTTWSSFFIFYSIYYYVITNTHSRSSLNPPMYFRNIILRFNNTFQKSPATIPGQIVELLKSESRFFFSLLYPHCCASLPRRTHARYDTFHTRNGIESSNFERCKMA